VEGPLCAVHIPQTPCRQKSNPSMVDREAAGLLMRCTNPTTGQRCSQARDETHDQAIQTTDPPSSASGFQPHHSPSTAPISFIPNLPTSTHIQSKPSFRLPPHHHTDILTQQLAPNIQLQVLNPRPLSSPGRTSPISLCHTLRPTTRAPRVRRSSSPWMTPCRTGIHNVRGWWIRET
jgi:hypothetical protein